MSLPNIQNAHLACVPFYPGVLFYHYVPKRFNYQLVCFLPHIPETGI